MNILLQSILIPFAAGLVCLLIPKKVKYLKEGLAAAGALAALVISIKIFLAKPLTMDYFGGMLLNADNLAGFVLLAIPVFTLLTVIYSIGFFNEENSTTNYYALILMTLGAANGAVLANNLILLLVFWGFLGFTLYLMMHKDDDASASAAKKTLIIVGGTDSLLVMGVALVYFLQGTFLINEVSIDFSVGLAVAAYLLLSSAAFAKAGCPPFHTWIPDVAKSAPLPSVAFLPASLDKLLGIYLLARCSLNMFVMTESMNTFLMALGAVTIIIAVMMALVQHDLKSLLGYHAVSQVGYMVLGIGTGSLLGIAGALFHMLNNAVYKSALFFTCGVVEKQTGTTDLDKLGGLSKSLKVSFIVCFVASLAIAGVPPLNGFFSKWMIYQGIIEAGKGAVTFSGRLWVLWLAAAMFGSALTLASFLKVLHAVFLGKDSGMGKVKEAPYMMLVPMGILAALCIVLGIGAYRFVDIFIKPILPEMSYIGSWAPGTATMLVVAGLLLGFVLYMLGNLKSIRRDNTFCGGEELPIESRITGTDFYKSIQDIKIFGWLYSKAEAKWFDIYDQGRAVLFGVGGLLRKAHNGFIHFYISWCLLGIILLTGYLFYTK